ncbi:glyoxylase-like metal-dependent hydrolase (beta-lactamase superfamily II)/rhodanese-related sulfurtransferase [Saccharothrix tamanrassetensis]|uniref:Glyoxylase-like metal-dependent hydrolase (Beta-lactamase superfamily II)/rhodanese-related sulfurtransferase n=1 Tax=Saccharothrix tamanrassetensis TaxID=1051531 RepID=A0A841CV48_9PSEU|nr:MBL fold metallo-hydrolase [Saccharothrix tamanrassetensis]MBB5960184.1 glyoxylase-like metal-dependent hydrolase (beta-lactamase superfamily II)/rhodanese-related sulfurtransferase [Saccharothrix tamanrassetensis]
MNVEMIDTAALGDRSYLVHDGTAALVVDPQRDIDRVEDLARRLGVRITHVAETHVHNDYLTGGLELSRRHDAAYLVAAAEDVSYARRPVHPGDEFDVGSMKVTALATPGHTEHHLAYVVTHDRQQAVFSGGSLLFGSVGRTDLVAPDKTVDLTRAQYHSARVLAEHVHEDATLHPTHGFGSFCSSGPATGAQASTIGEQLTTNHALTDEDEQHFVETLIAGLTAYPSYYSHMAPLNRVGPGAPDLTVPQPLRPDEVRSRIDAGHWVVDLRSRVAFASGHVRGTVSVEYGDNFTTYLGWTLPWGEPVTLVGSEDDVRAAIRDLSRIGVDRPSVGDTDGLPTTGYPRVGWDALAERAERSVVLDVRRADEYRAGHIGGALHIPLHDLVRRIDEVPSGEVWVHCASGYRAGIAAGLLHRAGRDVVHIDDDWTRFAGTRSS